MKILESEVDVAAGRLTYPNEPLAVRQVDGRYKVFHPDLNTETLSYPTPLPPETESPAPFVFTPVDVPNLTLFLNAGEGVLLNGSNVSGWLDGSPEGHNASQVAIDDQPELLPTGGGNGYPGVRFDRSNTEFLTVGNVIDPSNDYTIFAVIEPLQLTGVNEQVLLSSDEPLAYAALSTTTSDTVGGYDGTQWIPVARSILGLQILEWHWDSTALTLTCYRNGSAIGSMTYDGTMSVSGIVDIGRSAGLMSQYMDAILSELYVYNRQLTAQELSDLRSYGSTKYDLTFSPQSIADGIMWVRSDLDPILNASKLVSLGDQTGNINDAFNVTMSAQPAYVTGGSYPLARFDGVDDYLETLATIDSLIGSSPFSLMVVSSSNAVGTPIIGDSSVGPADRFALRYGTSAYGATDPANSFTSLATDALSVRHLMHDGTDLIYRQDGFELDRDTLALSSLPSDSLWIGRELGGYGPFDFYELALYARSLTAEETTSLEQYALSRYSGISGPVPVNNLVVWLRSDTGVTLVGADVSLWLDQSGLGNHAFQAVLNEQPNYLASDPDFNGLPSIRMEPGKVERLAMSYDSMVPTDLTAYFVMKPTLGVSAGYIWDAADGDRTIFSFERSAAETMGYFYNGVWHGDTPTLDDTAQIITYVLDSATNTGRIYRNGKLLSVGTYTAKQIIAGGFLSNDSDELKLAEVIVYNKAHNATELADAHSYLSSRFDISFSPLSVAGCDLLLDSRVGVVTEEPSEEFIVDGDMEKPGTTDWWANQATLSKQPVAGGGQALRVTADPGATTPYGLQTPGGIIPGKSYRATGRARSDGNFPPRLRIGGVYYWTGTTSTSWQYFDEVVIPVSNANSGIAFNPGGAVGTEYIEFDDLSVKLAVEEPDSLINDGFMELVGTASWDARDATLTKETTNPHTGSQLLRITADPGVGDIRPAARQTIMNIGSWYRLTGWARSDGTGIPEIAHFYTEWLGTTSTDWQPFDLTFRAAAAVIGCLFRVTNPTGTEYVELDDVAFVTTMRRINDGDMELTTTNRWTAGNNATRSKTTSTPHSGTRALRVARDGVNYPYVSQATLTPGNTYRVTGWGRSDGNALPAVGGLVAGIQWTGTSSTSWQPFDFIFTAESNTIIFQATTSTGTQYADFDDVMVTDTSGPGLVTEWADQSAEGRDVDESTQDNMPTYWISGGPNGLPFVQTDGVSALLRGIWAQSQPETLITLWLPSVSDSATNMYWFDGGSLNSLAVYRNAGPNVIRINAGAELVSDQTISNTTWHYATSVFNGVSASTSIDGSTPVEGPAGSNASNGFTIGAAGDSTLHSDMRAAIIAKYSRALNVYERAAVEDYMKEEAGL